MMVKLVDYFVPEASKGSEQNIRQDRARIQTVMTIATIILGFIITAVVIEFPIGLYALSALFLACSGSLWLIRRDYSRVIHYSVFLLACFVFINVIICYTGGVKSPIIYWIATTPVLGLLFLGLRGGVVTFVFAILNSVVLYLLWDYGIVFPNHVQAQYAIVLEVTTTVGFVCYLFMLCLYFEWAKNETYKELHEDIARSERLLRNIMPASILEELKTNGKTQAIIFNEATVLISDFKGYTQISEHLSPDELLSEINACFTAFDQIMEEHGLEKIKTMGDSYIAASGLPTPQDNHAERAIRAAMAMQQFMSLRQKVHAAQGRTYFEARIGVHTGRVIAGVVGVSKLQYDIWGDTVNTATRLESSGEPGRVNVSEQTRRRVAHLFSFTPRGQRPAKGKDAFNMYFLNMPKS